MRRTPESPSIAITAIVNPAARTASAAVRALRGDRRFTIREVPADAVASVVREQADRGASRVLVAGGDGTITQAASELLGSHTALAILRGGTLNHFARDMEIPEDPAQALEIAATGAIRHVDVGTVNGSFFLGTSAVGAYVMYVRMRRRLERWLGYRPASVIAALEGLRRVRGFSVSLVVEGVARTYDDSPLIFIAVGERDMRPPRLGAREAGGARQLHVFVVESAARRRIVRLVARMATRGIYAIGREAGVHAFLVDACDVRLPRAEGRVALDGELRTLRAPLEYRIRPDALAIVAPR